MPERNRRTNWADRARRSLARLRARKRRRHNAVHRLGGFRLSPRLTRREQQLLAAWIAALDPRVRVRLPRLEVLPASSILRYGTKILLDAEAAHRGTLPPQLRNGDRSTQAVSYVREKVIVLRQRLFRQRWLGQRLFYHELCHFLWPRLGVRARKRFVRHLECERARGLRGELGYSAQYRKARLLRNTGAGAKHLFRTIFQGQAWREYACESFCDTGAYALARAAGSRPALRSVEFTLGARRRPARLAAWWRTLV